MERLNKWGVAGSERLVEEISRAASARVVAAHPRAKTALAPAACPTRRIVPRFYNRMLAATFSRWGLQTSSDFYNRRWYKDALVRQARPQYYNLIFIGHVSVSNFL